MSARARAIAVLVLLLAAVPALAAAKGGAGAVQVEFTNARGLLEGTDVRIDGAPAGKVAELELSEDGTALATLELNEGLEPPRADATAAIRPVDLLGDNYLALEPGEADEAQVGPIPVDRTLNEPRLDDLLRVFDEPEREAMRVLLAESGTMLDARGADLNRAALALRPALDAANDLVAELDTQNADLRSLVRDAARVAGPAADHEEDIGPLVSSFEATLATTAEGGANLDASIAGAPRTLVQLRNTSAKLENTAREALPVTESIRRSAPGLSQAAAAAAPFLDEATATLDEADPAIADATEALERGEPTLTDLESGLGALTERAPAFDRFLGVLKPAMPAISEGFFQNFPDQAAEPGTQPFDPFADPRRHYWRGAGVMTCQSFGVPIEPGCLTRFLDSGSNDRDRAPKHGRGNGEGGGDPPAPDPAAPATPGGGSPPPSGGQGQLPLPEPSLPLPGSGGGGGDSSGGPAATDALLDFLFGK